jgi:hypothetical protein
MSLLIPGSRTAAGRTCLGTVQDCSRGDRLIFATRVRCPIGGSFVRDVARTNDGKESDIGTTDMMPACHRACRLCPHFTINTRRPPLLDAVSHVNIMVDSDFAASIEHRKACPALLVVIHRTSYTYIASDVPSCPLLVKIPLLAAPHQARPVPVDGTVLKLRNADDSHMVGPLPSHSTKAAPRLLVLTVGRLDPALCLPADILRAPCRSPSIASGRPSLKQNAASSLTRRSTDGWRNGLRTSRGMHWQGRGSRESPSNSTLDRNAGAELG